MDAMEPWTMHSIVPELIDDLPSGVLEVSLLRIICDLGNIRKILGYNESVNDLANSPQQLRTLTSSPISPDFLWKRPKRQQRERIDAGPSKIDANHNMVIRARRPLHFTNGRPGRSKCQKTDIPRDQPLDGRKHSGESCVRRRDFDWLHRFRSTVWFRYSPLPVPALQANRPIGHNNNASIIVHQSRSSFIFLTSTIRSTSQSQRTSCCKLLYRSIRWHCARISPPNDNVCVVHISHCILLFAQNHLLLAHFVALSGECRRDDNHD